MVVVIRMKNVTRFLLFAGSLVVWFVLLVLVNDSWDVTDAEELLLLGALALGVLQTWLLALVLGT